MKRSTERILTTHTGSLARPPELLQMLLAREEGQPVDPGVFDATVRDAMTEKVKRQVETGLAVVNDGEQSKISFATYVMERLHGFGGADEPRPRCRRVDRDAPHGQRPAQLGLVRGATPAARTKSVHACR